MLLKKIKYHDSVNYLIAFVEKKYKIQIFIK